MDMAWQITIACAPLMPIYTTKMLKQPDSASLGVGQVKSGPTFDGAAWGNRFYFDRLKPESLDVIAAQYGVHPCDFIANHDDLLTILRFIFDIETARLEFVKS